VYRFSLQTFSEMFLILRRNERDVIKNVFFFIILRREGGWGGGGGDEHKMCVLIFCTTFVWNISCCKKKSARCDQGCILVFMKRPRYSVRF
jgi:hypothetical protein